MLALCAGCDIIDPGDCVAIAGFALNVIVQDSATGAAPLSSARVIAQDGAFADTATGGIPNPAGTSYALAVERPGTYAVAIEAPGYQPWSRIDVHVTRSSRKCHQIQTVTLLARLQH
jgi:hypothetical protein